MWQDVDQRITRDIERLAADLAALVPSMVKPVVDILWFSSQLWALTGRRGSAVLYIYAALGFGCLRCVLEPEWTVPNPFAEVECEASIAVVMQSV